MEGGNIVYGITGLRGANSGMWQATNSGQISQGQVPNQSSVTGTVLLNPTPEQIGQMIADAYSQQIAEAQAQQGMTPDTVTLSEAVIVVGGVIVIIHYLNKAIRTAYFEAVGYIDQAQRNPDQHGGWRLQISNWIEQGLRRCWIPLWFNHEAIRAEAVQRNQDRVAAGILQPQAQTPIIRSHTPHPNR